MADDGATCPLPGRLLEDLKRAAGMLHGSKTVSVVASVDADGIAAAAIAVETLSRLSKNYHLRFERKMTDEVIRGINGDGCDLAWVCDLGSSCMGRFTRNGILVTDHHRPDSGWRRGQALLDSFGASVQVNPYLYGADGSVDICSAGLAYLVSRAADQGNQDLAYLAVVGAVGDFQEGRESGLSGWNACILDDAVKVGDVEVSRDILFYGRCTRPLVQFLQYGEPVVPGISGNPEACAAFFASNGVHTEGPDGSKRAWADLSAVEREVMSKALMDRYGAEEGRERLFGEVYSVKRYPDRRVLSDSKEFAMILSSCGRYDDPDTGVRICLGDSGALEDAMSNRINRRKDILSAVSAVGSGHLLRRRKYLQYFDSGSSIRDNILGIVAGMVLVSEDAVPDLPLIAFAESDGGTRVSARGTAKLADRGINLSTVMSIAAAHVGGTGGGYNVAAGATIPAGTEMVFLDKVEELISRFSP